MKNKIFINNILSLSTIQLMNYFFPIITFRYLVRILGVDICGLINFAAAFVGYFSLIIDYGFNISAVRDIAIIKDGKREYDRMISAVFGVKLSLLFISFILFEIVINNFKIFSSELPLYNISFLVAISSAISPQFFFQGMQKTNELAVVTFFVKMIWAISIFILVQNSNDYLIAALLNGSHLLLISLITFIIMLSKFKVSVNIPSKGNYIEQLRKGGMIFLSTCSISIYTLSNTFLLGILSSNTAVGYFVGADKIRQAFQNIITPLTMAGFPRASELFSNSINTGKKFIKDSLLTFGSLSFFVSLILYFFAPSIVNLILGEGFQKSIIVLKTISFLPFIIYLSNLFGIQTMLNLSMKKVFTIIIIIAAIISLILTLVFVPIYEELGAALSMLFTEVFVTTAIILYLNKKGFFSEKTL